MQAAPLDPQLVAEPGDAGDVVDRLALGGADRGDDHRGPAGVGQQPVPQMAEAHPVVLVGLHPDQWRPHETGRLGDRVVGGRRGVDHHVGVGGGGLVDGVQGALARAAGHVAPHVGAGLEQLAEPPHHPYLDVLGVVAAVPVLEGVADVVEQPPGDDSGQVPVRDVGGARKRQLVAPVPGHQRPLRQDGTPRRCSSAAWISPSSSVICRSTGPYPERS
ncbi:hypothetical protein Aph02nite_78200 [Actinoplanes philippinensis]|nr:hypothetical protein Aph02nite_78200 [Actinoplanes philippinensis]